jgi:hypothetical protein
VPTPSSLPICAICFAPYSSAPPLLLLISFAHTARCFRTRSAHAPHTLRTRSAHAPSWSPIDHTALCSAPLRTRSFYDLLFLTLPFAPHMLLLGLLCSHGPLLPHTLRTRSARPRSRRRSPSTSSRPSPTTTCTSSSTRRRPRPRRSTPWRPTRS